MLGYPVKVGEKKKLCIDNLSLSWSTRKTEPSKLTCSKNDSGLIKFHDWTIAQYNLLFGTSTQLIVGRATSLSKMHHIIKQFKFLSCFFQFSRFIQQFYFSTRFTCTPPPPRSPKNKKITNKTTPTTRFSKGSMQLSLHKITLIFYILFCSLGLFCWTN